VRDNLFTPIHGIIETALRIGIFSPCKVTAEAGIDQLAKRDLGLMHRT
jgi:hypothetical protein